MLNVFIVAALIFVFGVIIRLGSNIPFAGEIVQLLAIVYLIYGIIREYRKNMER